MIFDIGFLIIVIFSMLYGLKKGFFFTFIHTASWLIAIIGSIFITPWVKKPLMETAIYRSIEASVASGIDAKGNNFQSSLDVIPDNILNHVTRASESFLESIIANVSELAVIVFSFIALIIIIRIVLLILVKIVSNDNHSSLGIINKFLGLVLGLGRGILIVLLIITLMVPLLSVISPDTSATIFKLMEDSIITKKIFDANIIMQILGSFLA